MHSKGKARKINQIMEGENKTTTATKKQTYVNISHTWSATFNTVYYKEY